MINWGDSIVQQIGVVQDHFSNFFKIYHQELDSFKEVKFIK